MKNVVRYICAVLMVLGVSVNAWGGSIDETLYSIDQDAIAFGTVDASEYDYELIETYLTITVQLKAGFTKGSLSMAIDDDDDEVFMFDDYNTSKFVASKNTSYAQEYTEDILLYLPSSNKNYSGTLHIYIEGSGLDEDIEIPLSATVTGISESCISRSITMSDFSKDYGAADFVPTHTVSAGSGTKTWTSGTTSVATIVDGKVHIVSAGTSTITLSVAADGTNCAVEKSCTMTVNAVAPTVSKSELAVSGITSTSATLTGGKATATGGAAITQYGYIWGSSADVTWATKINAAGWNSAPTLNSEWGEKVLPLNTLSPNTTYYVRPFAYNGTVRGYGDAISFTTLQRYAVTYKINDGSATADQVEYKDHGVSYTISSDKFSRSGYTLVGWNTNNDGSGTGYDKGATYTGNAALTLYAVWGGTISFDANGGSGSMTPQVVASGGTYDLPSCTFTAPSGKTFKCWAQGSAEGTERAVGYEHTVGGNITFYAKWRDWTYTDYKFSCSELTLTPKLVTASTPIFITSAASKTVRSQDSILIVGSGLTPSQALEFPDLPSKFSIKSRANGDLSVKSDGTIDTVAYIFYTPGAGDTSDGLDKLTGIKVKVGGAKPITKSLTQDIIGRHLPTAGFVIAGKKDNKWYALPSNMASTGTPAPAEIAVDNIDNPTIAYTNDTCIYGLEGPTTSGSGNNVSTGNGQYVRLTMSINDGNEPAGPAPLFGTTTSNIGKSDNAKATSNLSAGYWWELKQTNTSITNPQDAKYTIKCANNSNALKLYKTNNVWGQYAYGTDVAINELRIIPASDVTFTEAYFIEWAQHGGVIEVDAQGIDATSVVAHLNGESSSAITLVQSKAGDAKNKSSKYNYTVNFGGSIDFAANEGQMLTLEWKNGETVKAITSIVVPKIIASTSTLSSHGENDGDWSSAEVHVLPGVTLTANAGDFGGDYAVTINHLEIYPGATVVVTKGSQASGTLKVKTLVLRNGWTRAGEKAYDVARLYITPSTASLAKSAVGDVWYADWYIDYDQYYPIAVPWDVTLANISYRYCSVEPTVGHDKNIRLRYYDGAGRATGTNSGSSNWKDYGKDGNTAVPTKLEPSKGYVISAKRPTGKAFSILRMPLTIPSNDWTAAGEQGEVSSVHKNQVEVTAHGVGGSAPWYAQGWNFIANPYMACYNGDDASIIGKLLAQTDGGSSVKYATIPDTDFKGFNQIPMAEAELKPSSGFLVQVNKSGGESTYNLTFSNGNIKDPSSAPARYTNEPEAVSEQEAYILLSNGVGEKDQMGLIIGWDYTANYEINADLSKMIGEANIVKTYMQYGGMDMAYVAINEVLAREWIPVTVHIPAAGEYTYSLKNSSTVNQLEGLYLIDYENGGRVTNLLFDDYTFTAEAGTLTNRFAINAIVGERKVPTGVDINGVDKNGTEPVKFIWHDKVFILHNNVIYDSTGKRVNVINK